MGANFKGLDPLRYAEPFYFGQSRVPATYLDGHGLCVSGPRKKLERILQKISKEKGHGLVAVVNSPGAALIGDDLERMIDEAGFCGAVCGN